MRDLLLAIITLVVQMVIVISTNAIMKKKKFTLIKRLRSNNAFVMWFIFCALFAIFFSTYSIGAANLIGALITIILNEHITRKESANDKADYKVEMFDLSKPLHSYTYNPADCKTEKISFTQRELIDSIKIEYLCNGSLAINFPFLLPTEVFQGKITTQNVKTALQLALTEFFSKTSNPNFKYPIITVRNDFPQNSPESEFYDRDLIKYREQYATDVLDLFFKNAKVLAQNCKSFDMGYSTNIIIFSDKDYYKRIEKRDGEVQKSRHKVKVKLKTKDK